MSLVSVAKPLGCNLCLSLTWTEGYGSADFGSHGCPWECGLQLLHLRGAETVPKGQGGVEWYFRVCTDDGPATCDWMGVARMLRRSNKQRYLLHPWQIIKAIRLSRDGFSSKVYTELLFCLLHCRAQFRIACFFPWSVWLRFFFVCVPLWLLSEHIEMRLVCLGFFAGVLAAVWNLEWTLILGKKMNIQQASAPQDTSVMRIHDWKWTEVASWLGRWPWSAAENYLKVAQLSGSWP